MRPLIIGIAGGSGSGKSTVARRVAGPMAGYRRRALRNLLMIRPTWPEEERRRVAEEVLDNFGRALIETYSWREFGSRMAEVPLSGGGLPHLEEARAQGRPVIFVTGNTDMLRGQAVEIVEKPIWPGSIASACKKVGLV